VIFLLTELAFEVKGVAVTGRKCIVRDDSMGNREIRGLGRSMTIDDRILVGMETGDV
jgi:hypothetical protein